MADLSITAISVVPGAGISPIRGVATSAIGPGDVVCVLADGTIDRADASAGAPFDVPKGIAISAALGAGQYVLYTAVDQDFTIGATVVPGEPYFLSTNPGKICDAVGLTAGMKSSLIGFGKGTTKLTVQIVSSGQTI